MSRSLVSRTVPVRYDPDFWPSSYEPLVPFSHDPWLYNGGLSRYNRIPYDMYEFERRPLTANRMWSSFDNEMARIDSDVKNWENRIENLWPRMDDLRHMELPMFVQDEIYRMKDRFNALPSVDDWRMMENFRMDNPIIEDSNGQPKFYLEYDLSKFKPEEITVKTSGHQLVVHAKHEEKNESHSSRREYSRTYLLPLEVNPEMLTSKLSDTGRLTIQASLPALPSTGKGRQIAIEHN